MHTHRQLGYVLIFKDSSSVFEIQTFFPLTLVWSFKMASLKEYYNIMKNHKTCEQCELVCGFLLLKDAHATLSSEYALLRACHLETNLVHILNIIATERE